MTDPSREVGPALVRIAVLVTERYETIGAELGVDSRGGRLLVAVGRRPESVGSIGARLRIPKSTTTSLLRRMVAAGLVAREPDATDRRSAIVVPTEYGLRIARELEARVRAAVLELVEPLDEAQRTALAQLLGAVILHADELDGVAVLHSE